MRLESRPRTCMPVRGQFAGSSARPAAPSPPTTRPLKAYRFDDAAKGAYAFVWGKTVCDWYLELSKPLLTGEDAALKAETQRHPRLGHRPLPDPAASRSCPS